ncbi:STAS domain-containing protein [Streptomyces sp. SID8379]|uniref:STAS domain-containing protein n=1 Tax=unclassified Streptomyces TaxID=2593676 RepID=UPI0003781DD8|nr:STAS domain-containing protein [Streptomyces sp. HmicA12]MYW65391.1 STAS domain-containing protein [Streptomyces sp. SID8379]
MTTATTHPILPLAATTGAPPPPPAAAPSPAAEPGPDPAPGDILIRSVATPDPHTLRITLAGEADHHSSAPLRVMLAAAADHGFTRLHLVTAAVTFADSGLLHALRPWPRQGRRLLMHGMSPAVARLLQTFALARLGTRP